LVVRPLRTPHHMNLYEMADRVDSKESFLAFVRALADDAAAAATEGERTPDGKLNLSPGGWEHGTIADFLYTTEAWATYNYGHTGEPHVPAEPSWRAFARLLHSGKFYE
jgi:hypothetical protein